jgi:hypothetical protein
LQTKTLPLACFNLTITPTGFTFWQIEQRSVLGTARVYAPVSWMARKLAARTFANRLL